MKMPQILKNFWANYYMMIKCVVQRFTNWTIMLRRHARSCIREHHVYCSTVSKGWKFHRKISAFPSDAPTKIWTLPLKWTVFSSLSFFLSQARKRLLTLGKQTQQRGFGSRFCETVGAKSFYAPCSLEKIKITSTRQLRERVLTGAFSGWSPCARCRAPVFPRIVSLNPTPGWRREK